MEVTADFASVGGPAPSTPESKPTPDVEMKPAEGTEEKKKPTPPKGKKGKKQKHHNF